MLDGPEPRLEQRAPSQFQHQQHHNEAIFQRCLAVEENRRCPFIVQFAMCECCATGATPHKIRGTDPCIISCAKGAPTK